MVSTGARVGARDFLAGLPVLGESDLYDAGVRPARRDQRRRARRRHRARARGALPRPQDRQGHRRPGRPSMADGRPRRGPAPPTTSRPSSRSAAPSCRRPTARSTRRTPSGCSTSGGRPRSSRRRWQRNAHVVAERDGQVVALANLGRLAQSYRDFPHVTGDREVMWKLYVHPDHQGLGIGSRLLGEIEALVEGDELWLEVVDGNEQAFGFYHAHGFAEVERVAGPRPWPDDVWYARSWSLAMSRFTAVRRRRPARPAGRPRRGARRHRAGRDGRLLARARDARVPAARQQRPDRARRARPPGRRAPARHPPAQQPRRHHAARCASCSTRPCSPSAASWPATSRWTTSDRDFREMVLDNLLAVDRGRGERAGVVRLAVQRRPARPTRRSRTCSAASCSTSASPG